MSFLRSQILLKFVLTNIWQLLDKFGQLFIPTSGHTALVRSQIYAVVFTWNIQMNCPNICTIEMFDQNVSAIGKVRRQLQTQVFNIEFLLRTSVTKWLDYFSILGHL